MDEDKTKMPRATQIKTKGSRRTATRKTVEAGMNDELMKECLDIIRQYRRKCGSFRQRYLDIKRANRVTKARIVREFVTTFEEMEDDARAAAQKLRRRLPPHRPLVQSDLVTYLAGRTVREA
ncbi:hypothetical protein CT676_29450 [Bradyrhizobium sp. MOS001]|uniref:hypothetical protein n=1 Tax=Bradyrhizobium sp. MOS001 TaxID=2133948 RepID=UPI0010751237|nr:hypothetical protein [Bradyrhizobium sp. MOS001]TFW57607.1 hypothetical protein CT676_29450 [Bradyrhizobium sp. MOS001]